jgi:hypothetical protein
MTDEDDIFVNPLASGTDARTEETPKASEDETGQEPLPSFDMESPRHYRDRGRCSWGTMMRRRGESSACAAVIVLCNVLLWYLVYPDRRPRHTNPLDNAGAAPVPVSSAPGGGSLVPGSSAPPRPPRICDAVLDGTCYALTEMTATADIADKECTTLGSGFALVSIMNQAQQAVAQSAMDCNGAVWIGLSYDATQRPPRWMWRNGRSPQVYENWDPDLLNLEEKGEQYSPQANQCAIMWGPESAGQVGIWYEKRCSDTQHAYSHDRFKCLCEAPLLASDGATADPAGAWSRAPPQRCTPYDDESEVFVWLATFAVVQAVGALLWLKFYAKHHSCQELGHHHRVFHTNAIKYGHFRSHSRCEKMARECLTGPRVSARR